VPDTHHAAAERKFFAISLIKANLSNMLEFDSVSNIMLCKELCQSRESHYLNFKTSIN